MKIWVTRISARWVLCGDRPVEDGWVWVGTPEFGPPRILATAIEWFPDGSSIASGPLEGDSEQQWAERWSRCVASLPESPQVSILDPIDLGDVTLLPGLVNAHTHLEFSDLTSPLRGERGSFASWIEAVVRHRVRGLNESTPDEWAVGKTRVARLGWREAVNSGTAAIGEVDSRPSAWVGQEDLRSTSTDGPLGCCFLEVLGLAPDRAEAALAWATNCLTHGSVEGGPGGSGPHSGLVLPGGFYLGLSPHAPYSTSQALYERTVGLCRTHRLPLATHLAETEEELQLLRERSGPLVDLFHAMGVWNSEAITARTPGDILRTVVEAPQLLIIHGNYLERDEWCWLSKNHRAASVVYCPQTHEYFGHLSHPWPQMLADGLNVALGTDSRASSQTLSLWEDILVVRRRYPEQPAELIWKLATVNSARALGLSGCLGELRPGSIARMAVARWRDSPNRWSWERLLTAETQLTGYDAPSLRPDP